MCLMHLKGEVMQRERTCFLMQCVLVLMLLVTSPLVSYAQSDCFEYSADGKTITGLTGKGMAATSLTIPYEVTCVGSNAFADANGGLTSLTIADGNPVFVSGFFGEHTCTLTYVDMGSGMSVDNMIGLLREISGADRPLESVVIEGYTGTADTWTEANWGDVDWTKVSRVTLSAPLVADQTFGGAEVYGRFTINKEIVSFCGSANFLDVDNGSNWLFYVADRCEGGFVHIQRVRYIKAGAGILFHGKHEWLCGFTTHREHTQQCDRSCSLCPKHAEGCYCPHNDRTDGWRQDEPCVERRCFPPHFGRNHRCQQGLSASAYKGTGEGYVGNQFWG